MKINGVSVSRKNRSGARSSTCRAGNVASKYRIDGMIVPDRAFSDLEFNKEPAAVFRIPSENSLWTSKHDQLPV